MGQLFRASIIVTPLWAELLPGPVAQLSQQARCVIILRCAFQIPARARVDDDGCRHLLSSADQAGCMKVTVSSGCLLFLDNVLLA